MPSRKAAVLSAARELRRLSHTWPQGSCFSAEPVPGALPWLSPSPQVLVNSPCSVQPHPSRSLGAGSWQSWLSVLYSPPPERLLCSESRRKGGGSGQFMYAVLLCFFRRLKLVGGGRGPGSRLAGWVDAVQRNLAGCAGRNLQQRHKQRGCHSRASLQSHAKALSHCRSQICAAWAAGELQPLCKASPWHTEPAPGSSPALQGHRAAGRALSCFPPGMGHKGAHCRQKFTTAEQIYPLPALAPQQSSSNLLSLQAWFYTPVKRSCAFIFFFLFKFPLTTLEIKKHNDIAKE